jgi:predicted tellurium resistance membrane protein TerC
MVDEIVIMIAAVVIAASVMVFTSTPLANFVERHPTVKMLALSFLLLIGFTLLVEGLHRHIPKGYIYFAMGFSVLVEMLNLRIRRAARPVNLRDPYKQAKLVPEGTAVPAERSSKPSSNNGKARKKKK